VDPHTTSCGPRGETQHTTLVPRKPQNFPRTLKHNSHGEHLHVDDTMTTQKPNEYDRRFSYPEQNNNPRAYPLSHVNQKSPPFYPFQPPQFFGCPYRTLAAVQPSLGRAELRQNPDASRAHGRIHGKQNAHLFGTTTQGSMLFCACLSFFPR
jgi:hypothetical protein